MASMWRARSWANAAPVPARIARRQSRLPGGYCTQVGFSRESGEHLIPWKSPLNIAPPPKSSEEDPSIASVVIVRITIVLPSLANGILAKIGLQEASDAA